MAYFVADEKLQGYYVSGGVTINIVKYHFECDNAASLPAQTAFISSKKVKISMASTAHTIDTDALYKMDSSGAWVQQSQPWQPIADYSVLSNKPQINGHTLAGNQTGAALGLQNTLTFDSTPTQNSVNPVTSGGIWADQQRQDALQIEDRAALVEQIDAGSKNIADMSKTSYTTLTKDGVTVTLSGDTITASGTGGTQTNNFFNVFLASSVLLVPAGTWVIALVGAGIDNFRVEEYDNAHSDVIKGNFGQPLTVTVPDNATLSYIRITSKPSTNCAGTFKLMICTAAAWKISQTFQSYRPSWQEMYDMILALQ